MSKREWITQSGRGPALHPGVWILALVAAGFLLTACATQSVRHLNRHPWALNQPQHMRTNYLQFDYVCTQKPDGLKVQGTARPLADGPIPEWATWTRDLWLGAYLSDRTGQVLAKKLTVMPAQRLDREHPIHFSFLLQPQSMGKPGPVFISFGYRLVLARGPDTKGHLDQEKNQPEKNVFFASESALTRF